MGELFGLPESCFTRPILFQNFPNTSIAFTIFQLIIIIVIILRSQIQLRQQV